MAIGEISLETLEKINKTFKDKDEQITQLKADLAKYKRLYEKNRKFLNTTMKRLEDSSWENEQDLKEYLKQFAGHTAECACLQENWPEPTGDPREWVMPKCDCGLDKAKEGWE